MKGNIRRYPFKRAPIPTVVPPLQRLQAEVFAALEDEEIEEEVKKREEQLQVELTKKVEELKQKIAENKAVADEPIDAKSEEEEKEMRRLLKKRMEEIEELNEKLSVKEIPKEFQSKFLKLLFHLARPLYRPMYTINPLLNEYKARLAGQRLAWGDGSPFVNPSEIMMSVKIDMYYSVYARWAGIPLKLLESEYTRPYVLKVLNENRADIPNYIQLPGEVSPYYEEVIAEMDEHADKMKKQGELDKIDDDDDGEYSVTPEFIEKLMSQWPSEVNEKQLQRRLGTMKKAFQQKLLQLQKATPAFYNEVSTDLSIMSKELILMLFDFMLIPKRLSVLLNTKNRDKDDDDDIASFLRAQKAKVNELPLLSETEELDISSKNPYHPTYFNTTFLGINPRDTIPIMHQINPIAQQVEKEKENQVVKRGQHFVFHQPRSVVDNLGTNPQMFHINPIKLEVEKQKENSVIAPPQVIQIPPAENKKEDFPTNPEMFQKDPIYLNAKKRERESEGNIREFTPRQPKERKRVDIQPHYSLLQNPKQRFPLFTNAWLDKYKDWFYVTPRDISSKQLNKFTLPEEILQHLLQVRHLSNMEYSRNGDSPFIDGVEDYLTSAWEFLTSSPSEMDIQRTKELDEKLDNLYTIAKTHPSIMGVHPLSPFHWWLVTREVSPIKPLIETEKKSKKASIHLDQAEMAKLFDKLNQQSFGEEINRLYEKYGKAKAKVEKKDK